MRSSTALCFAIAVFMFILSVPGIPDQIREFAAFIGMSGYEWHWWNYVGVSLGLILMLFSLYPVWLRAAGFFKGDAAVNWAAIRATVIAAPLALWIFMALAAGLGAYIVFAPSYIWHHPTIPLEKQPQIVAECRMAAIKASTAAMGRDRDRETSRYERNCLIQKGFRLVEIDR